jgi:hypothetical protein
MMGSYVQNLRSIANDQDVCSGSALLAIGGASDKHLYRDAAPRLVILECRA